MNGMAPGRRCCSYQPALGRAWLPSEPTRGFESERRAFASSWCSQSNSYPRDGRPRLATARMSGWACLNGFRPAVKGRVRFETRLELKRAMLCDSGGRPPWLATELHRFPHLIVVDEVHRHRRVLEVLSEIFLEADRENRSAAEAALTKPFRSPARGRRAWPKWLFLSATPFNPVSLDTIDPLDQGSADETLEERDGHDEEALASEIEKTFGALAFLAGRDLGDWFSRHVAEVKRRLTDGHIRQPIRPPRQLVVWPTLAKQGAFAPPAKPRWSPGAAVVSTGAARGSLGELIRLAESLEGGSARLERRRAATERFVLSGGNMEVRGYRIMGEVYSGTLARCVARAVGARKKAGDARPAKLQGLLELICGPAKGQNVLVFCVHRAVARAVVKELQVALGEVSLGSKVRLAAGSVNEGDQRWFNRAVKGKTRVLVATDGCSESIDLHQRADVLVHYELPWSPLRVLQRVGRLWRIRQREIEPGERPRTPRLPGIIHFAHPGSVDEEILSRLWRRWGHLRVMGLDYLTYQQAMGRRLPAVSWDAGVAAR